MSSVLLRKLRRDMWRQRWQFLAATTVIAIGVAVFVAGTNANTNLRRSVDLAYAGQLLPDAVITGPGAFSLRDAPRKESPAIRLSSFASRAMWASASMATPSTAVL